MRHLRSLCLLILLASYVSSALPAAAAPCKRAGQEPAVPARFPDAIVRGPDNALWFTEQVAGRIGRITPGGDIREYSLPTPRSGPSGIVLGPDGALWFAEQYADRIGRLDPRAGSVREYVLPARGFRPDRIAAGPDGALWFTADANGTIWFTEQDADAVASITPGGIIHEYPL